MTSSHSGWLGDLMDEVAARLGEAAARRRAEQASAEPPPITPCRRCGKEGDWSGRSRPVFNGVCWDCLFYIRPCANCGEWSMSDAVDGQHTCEECRQWLTENPGATIPHSQQSSSLQYRI